MSMVAAPSIPKMVGAGNVWAPDRGATGMPYICDTNWHNHMRWDRVGTTWEVALMYGHGSVVRLDTRASGHVDEGKRILLEPTALYES